MEEIWINIRGYNGKYQVSNTGKVRSTNYNNSHTIKELKQKLNKHGYYEVKLSKNNKAKDYMVGRLVAEAFIPNPNYKPEVMHINSPTDNSVENLCWAYDSEVKHNTYNRRARKSGNPTFSTITYNGKNYNSYYEIAKDLGINYKTFWNRMKRGWGLYEALEIPTKLGGNNDGNKL